MQKENENTISKRYIDYIVVVHGIGEQRQNETILPVINRIAELRHGKKMAGKKNAVTLGMITSQTGQFKIVNGNLVFPRHPWAEFEGIPQEKPKTGFKEPFYGEMSVTGENIRFVDMYWADIMQMHFASVGEPLEIWADSLISRLELRKNYGKLPTGEEWILPILYRLEEMLTLMQSVISLKMPGVSDEIFNKFLGDVQLYGEYSVIRGMAVNRFHRVMENIEEAHLEYHNLDSSYYNAEQNQYIYPRYTIVAHSLGTVMSLDALMYAHIETAPLLEEVSPFPNLPFPEYDSSKVKNHKYFGSTWIEHVDSYVTLGSPIDKFLTIWWHNYKYLEVVSENPETKAMERSLPCYFMPERPDRIAHFNYCDEQDPVGHALDILDEKPPYQRYFYPMEDMVYNRYTVPGSAHVDYWKDIQLFKRILDNTVDAPEFRTTSNPKVIDDGNFEVFKESVRSEISFFSYYFFPIIAVVLSVATFTWAFLADSIFNIVVATAAFVVSWFISMRLVKIMIWWRQILKIKRLKNHAQNAIKFTPPADNHAGWVLILLLIHIAGTLIWLPEYIENDKESHTVFFKVVFIAVLLSGFIFQRFRTRTDKNVSVMNNQVVPTQRDTDGSTWVTTSMGVVLALCVCVAVYMDFHPLSSYGILSRFDIFTASYFASSALVWTYTLSSLYYAHKNIDNA